MTQPYGSLPDFLIVGAQKSGTSSLFAFLTQHPRLRAPVYKELHYFDARYNYQSVDWYRSCFPDRRPESAANGSDSLPFLTGEATPYYLFHPSVPRRVAEVLPGVKLMAILRNPVDRAYSHYHMAVRAKREDLSFEDAIAAEAGRLDGETERLMADDAYRSRVHIFNSYLARGVYVDQLARWAAYFPSDRMLVLKAEDLRADPAATTRKALDFLGLPPCELDFSESRNTREYPTLAQGTRQRLAEYFEPHNHRLYDYLGVDFDWR
jgi:hypothetical protein